MKNSTNRNLTAIIVLPAFLAISAVPLSAEVIMGANGQPQSVVTPEQVTDTHAPESVQKDAFESGALSTPSDPKEAAAKVIPGQIVEVIEDSRVSVYIYLDAAGKKQAAVYDKDTNKTISQIQRVQINAGEQVL